MSLPSIQTTSSTMNWEPIRQKLLSTDLNESFRAATELRERIQIVYTNEFPLMLAALLPAFSSVLTQRTTPSADTNSIEHKLRHLILDIISKMPTNSILRPHAPHCVALCIDVLNRDYEENALLASRVIFDLHKAYRSLPQDYVQPYLDFVASAYRSLPMAVQRNFTESVLQQAASASTRNTSAALSQSMDDKNTSMEVDNPLQPSEETASPDKEGTTPMDITDATEMLTISTDPELTTSPQSTSSSQQKLALKANLSFRVLTESPLIVMLMFQLWPAFLKTNIPVLISVMMEALSLRAPPLDKIIQANLKVEADSNLKRTYYSRVRELVAAQAKTLSFVTYLLRSFSNELKPYEEKLATNVVTLMTTCPRESIATRKELLVATRHLLNTDFRKGFFKHIDALLDERVLIGKGLSYSDQALLRPLGFTMLSDLVQHVRNSLNMSQMTRIVLMFARALHDSTNVLPMSTQYMAVRTLLTMGDVITNNKDPNPQHGRDLLVRIFSTLTDKLKALNRCFPCVFEAEKQRAEAERLYGSDLTKSRRDMEPDPLSKAPTDTVRDVQIMVRAIIVGNKSLIQYIHTYRDQRAKDDKPHPQGSNEEVYSALQRITQTEMALIDEYILAAFPAIRLLKEDGPGSSLVKEDKARAEHHREALTYFAATFIGLDGFYLARILGRRLNLMIDALVDDSVVMVFVRHLLGSNATTSLEFCGLLLELLVTRMDELASPRDDGVVFFNCDGDDLETEALAVTSTLHELGQRPFESLEHKKRVGTTLLQLFERILKSLAAFSDNEGVVRKHLRKIVFVCFKSSMEQTCVWPDNYCMLLRYIFRSISAGKFEESYRDLLPLLPTVLNGLYRISVSHDEMVRNTAVELCLTIPARLSSLLPHLNLLVRVIIPALDSNSGDLVNLGLRTLEFWVDNLNPQFLYPEITKQKKLFASLMQSLSRHLRPAPYPYGLLTLRLLGKLGGKNREFLREPLPQRLYEHQDDTPTVAFNCVWSGHPAASGISLRLSLRLCMEMLKTLASRNEELVPAEQGVADDVDMLQVRCGDAARQFTMDHASYNNKVIDRTLEQQAEACLVVVKKAIDGDVAMDNADNDYHSSMVYDMNLVVCQCLLFASSIASTAREAASLLDAFYVHQNKRALHEGLATFLAAGYTSTRPTEVAVNVARIWAASDKLEAGCLLELLCSECCSATRVRGLTRAICAVMDELGPEHCRDMQFILINTATVTIKSVPREITSDVVESLRFFVRVCVNLYGSPWLGRESSEEFCVWDVLSLEHGDDHPVYDTAAFEIVSPNDEVFRLLLTEVTTSQQVMRFAARFALTNFIVKILQPEKADALVQRNMPFIRRLLFSRALRLLPLPAQVGIIEGLAFFVKSFPTSFNLTEDQHFMSFLSELLKLSSVADGEMSDKALLDCVVDKNGFALANGQVDPKTLSHPSHASSVFLRRVCVFNVGNARMVCPEELPAGVQMRVSGILLLHSVIKVYSDAFFDADSTTPVGNIRPHVISLFFRSLVCWPAKTVSAAHFALVDVLSLSLSTTAGDVSVKSQTRLPKELLQTCIRPVLLNLREHTRLTVPLLRGLKRLLSLLSNWFNRTLGDKLLDHLQKWTDPVGIIGLETWKGGEAIMVAAAVVDIFSLLPSASHFVDPLVKTCIRLEATLPVYKVSFVTSPFRRPLAKYLNRHVHQTVGFFFPRLKTPTYSELFLQLLQMNELEAVRTHLGDKQCSIMLLNICFERPLAIVRQDKNAESPATKDSLYVHGIGTRPTSEREGVAALKHMDTLSQESQIIGLRLVEILAEHDQSYFMEHGDIVRAFRWLWRSRGRLLRMQHEQFISPRYQKETTYLMAFLMSYAKSYPEEGLDILFELVRGSFLPSTKDCASVISFIKHLVRTLAFELKKQVVHRFFALLAGESSEDTKVLSTDYILIPLLEEHFRYATSEEAKCDLFDVQKFVKEALLNASGDRLRASLLIVCHILIIHMQSKLELFSNQLVKFCWGQLKSDDYTCKGWSHLVICDIIKAYGLQAKLMVQLYGSLLKACQQEGRDLVRLSLDALLPSLRVSLPSELYNQSVNQASKIMLEEGSSTPLIAHVCHMVVRNPGVFESRKGELTSHMVNALAKLGLPPNLQNRVISISVVELLLSWGNDEMLCSLVNFLVRLKMLVSEKIDNTTSASLVDRCSKLLAKILSDATKEIDVHIQPFEKAMRESQKHPGLLSAAIEVICILADTGQERFFVTHNVTICELLGKGLAVTKDDNRMQEQFSRLVSIRADAQPLAKAILVSVDAILQTVLVSKKTLPPGRPTGRGREQEMSDLPLSFYLELVLALCRRRGDRIGIVAGTLLSVATHLVDSLGKQRQASYSIHYDYHSPTMGITQAACLQATMHPSKTRSKDELALLLILDTFQTATDYLVFTFSHARKDLLQLVASIFDTTDNVDLLVAAGRMICFWLLHDTIPLTAHERSSFLSRICNGSVSLPDLKAQRFVDFVAHFVEQLRGIDIVSFNKSVMFCLLNPDLTAREQSFRSYFDTGTSGKSLLHRLSKLMQSNYEAITGRFWGVIFVDGLLDLIEDNADVSALSLLSHGNAVVCQTLLEQLLRSAWSALPGDGCRILIQTQLEELLSRATPAQFLKDDINVGSTQNTVRSFLKVISSLRPAPVFSDTFLVYLAENYNAWHEVLDLIERPDPLKAAGVTSLQAIRHCYHLLGEHAISLALARLSCRHPLSNRAITLDVAGMVKEAVSQYEDLVDLVDSDNVVDVSDFEVDFWQERWSELQRDLEQVDTVKEIAKGSNSYLELEVSWKNNDWTRVRSLATNDMLASIEAGDPIVKIAETILCVAEGKLSDVENLHAQSAQLALHRWQLLPKLSGGSNCHMFLLHLFHRLVEIREAGQVMVESANHSSGKTLPDLKNLLSAWRHRLPQTSDSMSFWGDIVACRCFIYESICAKFRAHCDSNTLAGLHDRPWTLIRMAKAARKHNLNEVSLDLLSRAVDVEGAMSVSDAFFKLREQILVYSSGPSDLERHGSLNLLNTTNFSFFDSYQKSELFRIKALILNSLGSRSKANQACCHSPQICPTHGRAWETWGTLCSSLASMTDKAGSDGGDPKTTAKKVAQYLAQAMGCYLEAVLIDSHEGARIHLPKCLYMLTKDGETPGVLCATLESRGSQLPPWVWLPWLAQLLTSFCRLEGKAIKTLFARVVKAYPQAAYYSLRTFYLERRDAERAKSEQTPGLHMQSVALAEEMMSLLRRSHTYLWSTLEAILEELIVKFRPSAEEELLGPIIALLERAETQQGSPSRSDDASTSMYIWKTIWRISAKFFKDLASSARSDDKANKTSLFKTKYKEAFEADFHVSASDPTSAPPVDTEPPVTLDEFTRKLNEWKTKLETSNTRSKVTVLDLADVSPVLASFVAGDSPGLWTGSCDSKYTFICSDSSYERDNDPSASQSTSSSVTAARKAAATASAAAATAAVNECVGGDFGGGSAAVEIPGFYPPNSNDDGRPRVELHAKLTKFRSKVDLLRRGDQVVRRVTMVGSDGNAYAFLVQAAVPYWTRVQERTTQFNFILAKCLATDINASRNHYAVHSQPIIALAQRLRLVSEPSDRTSLEEVLLQRCIRTGRDTNRLCLQFNAEVKSGAETVPDDGVDVKGMHAEVRLRAFQRAQLESENEITALREHVHARLGGVENLFAFRRTFSQQWAANCLLQYAFSVAERTPGRVSFAEDTGAVFSPDFRVSYNSQGYIDTVILPFRLTANLCSLIGFPLLDGRFALSLSGVSGALRICKAELAPILKLLMRDDLLAFYTRSMPKSDTKTQEMEKQLKDRFSANSAVIMGRLCECAIRLETGKDEPIDARVIELILNARSPENLCKMQGSFQAWL
ncbi:hypothetical protein MPSEU_001098900 [Mayamaea pseudoterrestris]|nr:hypothetical protein MPSEU_001098900 [Mayamaea pseudoterrestris]